MNAGQRKVLQVTLSAMNEDVISDVISSLKSLGVRLLLGHQQVLNDRLIQCHFFIELPESVLEERVRSEVEEVEGVVELRMAANRFGRLIMDMHHFPIVDDDDRALMLSVSDLIKTFDWIISMMGTGGKYALFLLGLGLGACTAKRLMERGRISSTPSLLQALASYMRSHGFGIVKVRGSSLNRLVVEVDNCFEASIARGLHVDGCYFMEGFITGALRALFLRDDVVADEVKCVIRGAKKCVFKTKVSPLQTSRSLPPPSVLPLLLGAEVRR